MGTAPANGGAAGNLSRASNGSSGMPGNFVSIDRLVLNGTAASASGHTTIQITNLSGLGAQMKWRTGCEGRISLLKRRHGLDRCRYRGTDGMKRWVGLGVTADNLINIAQALEASPAFCAGK